MKGQLAVATALWLLVLSAAGCASAPVQTAPGGDGESYVRPVPRPGELNESERRRFDDAWTRLEAGRWWEATKRLRPLLRSRKARPAPATAHAYCILRSGRYDEAERLFGVVLLEDPASPSALVGAALAATHRGHRVESLDFLRRASAAAPDDAVVRRLYAETRVQLTEAWVGDARAAIERGDVDSAIKSYEQTLEVAPEVAGVRLELAEALLVQQRANLAADVLSADPTSDRAVLLRLGQVLQGLQDFDRAISVYQRLLGHVPSDSEARRAMTEAIRSRELLALPEEVRRLPSAARATRADLAALLVLRLGPLAEIPPGEPEVAVDISGSWAREQIVRVLALRILEVYPNHTFQPGGGVRRGDLAIALGRVLDLLGVEPPPSRLVFADVSPNSPLRDAVADVVGLGIMEANSEQGVFEPWRAVSGREAWDAVEALSQRLRRRPKGAEGVDPTP